MKNSLKKRHSWRTLICALLIAALAMMGAVAEDGLVLELNLEGTVNESDLNVTVDDKAVSDNTGIAVELDGEVVHVDDTPVSGELELDGLNLSDGFGGELTQAGDASDENAGFTATNSAPEDFEIDENGVLVKYVGPGGDVVIPDGVTSIGEQAFSGCTGLTSITIPDSVTSIGEQAFLGCTGLTSITIPNGVTSIGQAAFSWCDLLESIKVSGDNPNYTSKKGILYTRNMKTLLQCPGAKTSVTIPNSVTSIGDLAFIGCKSLTSITIPNSVTSIGQGAFVYCEGLSSITIPNSVTSIGEAVFYDCIGLKSITIPNSVTSISKGAFYNCVSLKSITIPNSVTSIGEQAFSGCTGLKSIMIPNSVTSIGVGAFIYCEGLKSITIPNSVTSIGDGVFSDCYGLKSITIPNSVTSIGVGAFNKCSSLTSITIPNSVTSIGEYAFHYCPNLTSVTIPASVTKIGEYAFLYCDKVTIYGKAGSYAEKYAKENDIPFAPVEDDQPTSISITQGKTATLYAGKTLKLKAKVEPKGAKTTLKWTSSNPKVATVTQKGVVKALKKGTAVITVETVNGKKATCKITVPTAPTKVAFAKKTYSVKVGKTVKLTAKLTPAKARTTLTWTISDKKVATVTQKGVVKGVKKGTATITVKTANGKKASVKVTVQ